MQDRTENLGLPYIMAAQAQKHVTHNEAIRALDVAVQLAVKGRGLAVPPSAPSAGERYIPASGSTGAWSGRDGQLAAFQDNGWAFYPPQEGWRCWVVDEGSLLVHDGSSWNTLSAGPGSGGAVSGGTSTLLNSSANGETTSLVLLEEEVSLSGAGSDSSIAIPARAIVFAVTTRTTEAITGASSYDCGIAGETGKYGGSLGIAAGSSNSGVTGPTAYYADTPVRLSANGGNFSGGKVRIAIHFMTCGVPTG